MQSSNQPRIDAAQFRMKKDRMVLRVPEGDNKEREYDVVAVTPVEKAATGDNGKEVAIYRIQRWR